MTYFPNVYNRIMSYLAKGQFKLPQSWDKKGIPTPKNLGKNELPALKNAARNILQTPNMKNRDDSKSKHLLKEFDAQIPPLSTKSEKKIPGKQNPKLPPRQKVQDSLEQSLISSMESRIKQVQMTCSSQRSQIKTQNSEIDKLKAENQFLKGLRADSGQACHQMDSLRNQNQVLQKKVDQMMQYLQKYGLKWVGNQIEGQLDGKKLKKDIKKPKFDYKLPTEIDIGTIKRRTQDLNAGLHSQGYGTQIYVVNGIHRFRKAEPLPLKFYKNGISIRGYSFHYYKEEDSLKILNDILDGYFPYVLKSQYPNGVFLEVIDKTDQQFTDETSQNKQGTTPKNQLNQGLNQQSKPATASRMTSIRKPIKKAMSQKILPGIKEEDTQDFLQIEGDIVFKTTEHVLMQKNQYPPELICSLKIRTDTGKICILTLAKNSKIRTVYDWMSRVVKIPYRLMSNYPKRAYQETEMESLDELGLYPNALLHVHLIQQDPR